MTKIGHFTSTPDGFHGRVRTLTLDLELCLVPAEKSDADNAPDYRIHLGSNDQGSEVGAAWKRTGGRAGAYVSLQIDDQALPHAISANLFRSAPDDPAHHLVWNRQPRREARS